MPAKWCCRDDGFAIEGRVDFNDVGPILHQSRAQFGAENRVDLSAAQPASSALLALIIEWRRWPKTVHLHHTPEALQRLATALRVASVLESR